MVDSYAKLRALRLPPLRHKRVLDIGCNEGYYCDVAFRSGAVCVVGIDASPNALQAARERFPHLDFRECSWDSLPKGTFDVVLLTSVLHYAKSVADLCAALNSAAAALSDDGVLVIETGLAQEGTQDLEEYTRPHREIVRYPSRRLLYRALSDARLVVREVGASISADERTRLVFHCRRRHPNLLYVSGATGIGKTSLAETLGLPTLQLDAVTKNITQQIPALQRLLQLDIPLSLGAVTACGANFWDVLDFVKHSVRGFVLEHAGDENLVLEGYLDDSLKVPLLEMLRSMSVHLWEVEALDRQQPTWMKSSAHVYDGALQLPKHPGFAYGTVRAMRFAHREGHLEVLLQATVPLPRLQRATVSLRPTNPTEGLWVEFVTTKEFSDSAAGMVVRIPEECLKGSRMLGFILVTDSGDAIVVDHTLLQLA